MIFIFSVCLINTLSHFFIFLLFDFTFHQVCEVFIPLHSILDKEKERKRLQRQIDKLCQDIDILSKRLNNKNFVDKAPLKIYEESTRTLHEHQTLLVTLEKSLMEMDE